MIVRHREGQTPEYTMAMDKVEKIALECVIDYALHDVTRAGIDSELAAMLHDTLLSLQSALANPTTT